MTHKNFNTKDRRRLVTIWRQLGTMTEADEQFALDPKNSEIAVENRMIGSRQRAAAKAVRR